MKLMIGLLAAAILGTGGFAFASGVDDTKPARTVSVPGTTTAGRTAATTTDDIVIGNPPAATPGAEGGSTPDVSGPCDEAEHADDPRCAGPAREEGDDDEDNSGPGSGDEHGRDGDDNSGHGSSHSNDNDDD